jgi:MFS transporter, ACS family, tartrate transporter
LSALPVFWSLPTDFLSAVAGVALALINVCGNLVGYFIPLLVAWIKTETGGFTNALYLLALWLIRCCGHCAH